MKFQKMKSQKGSVLNVAMTVAIGVILLTAVVLPFLNLGAESNATPTRLGLPVAGYTGLLLLILVVFIFGLVKWKKS